MSVRLPALFLLCACSATAHAARYYPPAAVAAAQRALAAPAARTAADVGPRLQLALARAAGDPLAAELEMRDLLIAARDSAGDPALRRTVEALTQYRAQAITDLPDPDQARGATTRVADVAAAARGTLREWTLRANAQVYGDALLRLQYPPLPDPQDPPALAQAIDALPAAHVAALAATHGADLPPPALHALAARVADAALYDALLRSGDAAEILPALPEIARQLPAADALQLLSQATIDPRFGSAAALAIGRIDDERGAAREFLLAHLGDARLGGSCAQALSVHPSRATVDALGLRLARAHDDLPTRRALLALHLMHDAQAGRVLAAFAADERMPAELRDTVASWLR